MSKYFSNYVFPLMLAHCQVHVLQLPLSLLEVQGQSEERLWEVVAMQVLSSHLADANCKYLAFLGATRYHNRNKQQVSSIVDLEYQWETCLNRDPFITS